MVTRAIWGFKKMMGANHNLVQGELAHIHLSWLESEPDHEINLTLYTYYILLCVFLIHNHFGAFSFCTSTFFLLHPTILNIPKLTLTYNLKRGTMLDFLYHCSSSSVNINHWWRVFVVV